MVRQLFRCFGIFAERFLNDDTIPASMHIEDRENHYLIAWQQCRSLAYFVPMHVSLINCVTDANTDGGNAK